MSKDYEPVEIEGHKNPFLGPRLTEYIDRALSKGVGSAFTGMSIKDLQAKSKDLTQAVHAHIGVCDRMHIRETIYETEPCFITNAVRRNRSSANETKVEGITFKALIILGNLPDSTILHYTPDGKHNPESYNLYLMRKGFMSDAIQVRHTVPKTDIEKAESLLTKSLSFIDDMIAEHAKVVSNYSSKFELLMERAISERIGYLESEAGISSRIAATIDNVRSNRPSS